MSLPDNEAMHVLSPSVFAHRLTSLGRTVFQDNRIEAICPEKPVPTASPTKLSPSVCTPHTVFRHIRRDVICPENPCAQLCAFSLYCFLQTELSPSYFPQCPFPPQIISHGFPSVHPFIASVSLLPLGALTKLFPTISLPSTLSSLPCRSFPSDLSPSYFPRFPFRPPSRCFRIGSPALCSPAISTLPAQLSPSYFHVLDPQEQSHSWNLS